MAKREKNVHLSSDLGDPDPLHNPSLLGKHQL